MESKIENSFLTNQQLMILLKMGLFLGVDALFAVLSTTVLVEKELIISQYVPFMIIVYIFLFSVLMIGIKKKTVSSMMLYGVLLVLSAAGLIVFNLSLWIMALILLFLHWRISSYFKSEDDQIEVSSGLILLFLCLSALSIIIGNTRELENNFIVMSLILFLFSLVSTVTSVQRMLNAQDESENKNKRYLVKPFAILLFVITAGGVLAFFSPYVRSGFYWVLNKIFWLFSFLVNPIFAFLVKVRDWIISKVSKDTLSGFGMKFNQETIDQSKQNAFYEGMSMSWLNELLIAIFILTVIIYFVKKRKVTYEVETNRGSSPIMTSIKKVTAHPEKNAEEVLYSDAENAIRQAMKELEREAANQQKGREDNENIRDWFYKIGMIEEEAFFKLYESVRYGTKIPENHEVSYFTQRVKRHISSLNEKEN
ncbi:hypothetical protein AAEO50_17675 [Rossellomorea oryzaecorticis]|uniref:DUF4129 domain-containing protein n=1 Tax=Rossellomorea oryzaecorticis TaxID=1396505 RepID=A0ABU9KDL6_9BACI